MRKIHIKKNTSRSLFSLRLLTLAFPVWLNTDFSLMSHFHILSLKNKNKKVLFLRLPCQFKVIISVFWCDIQTEVFPYVEITAMNLRILGHKSMLQQDSTTRGGRGGSNWFSGNTEKISEKKSDGNGCLKGSRSSSWNGDSREEGSAGEGTGRGHGCELLNNMALVGKGAENCGT